MKGRAMRRAGQYVDSGPIERVGKHDGEAFPVTFRGGRATYRVHAPESVQRELLSADSMGAYYNRNIRHNDAYRVEREG